ncbi:MAG: glycosyltransferase family 2 protein [Candidatus Peribacteraceae bacterium]|nr:glycosyltransferase family 2 protein [Candidatus Peribacteraceae bacterium]
MTAFSVIIPAYNEQDGIGSVIDVIRAQHPSAEIIVVDDGSTDATAQKAAEKGVQVVRHPANAGYGKSLKDGILMASNDIIVITDADGSYPVETMQTLVDTLEQGFDMVVGARQGTKQYDSFLKAPARLFFRFLVEFTVGRHIPDINSGFRAFRKSQALPYFPDLCQGFSFTTTITLIYCLTSKFVTYLPIEYRPRIGKSKVRIIRDSLRTLQYITEVIATYNPLKLFLLLTAMDLACAGIAAIIAIVFANTSIGILASLLLVGSFILFGMGIMAYSLRGKRPSL